jgi:AraC family transcriptional regulator
MEPRIETIGEKKLAGISLPMSLAHNRTGELWGRFMPLRKELRNAVGAELYSLQVYDPSYFHHFHPEKEFHKWAAVEVNGFDDLPPHIEPFTLAGGLYAVFHYKGLSTDGSIFQYIYTDWLPRSGYMLDDRPHFEVLGASYRNGDPDSEEEIWIPVRGFKV